jgi:hypothetical protein
MKKITFITLTLAFSLQNTAIFAKKDSEGMFDSEKGHVKKTSKRKSPKNLDATEIALDATEIATDSMNIEQSPSKKSKKKKSVNEEDSVNVTVGLPTKNLSPVDKWFGVVRNSLLTGGFLALTIGGVVHTFFAFQGDDLTKTDTTFSGTLNSKIGRGGLFVLSTLSLAGTINFLGKTIAPFVNK